MAWRVAGASPGEEHDTPKSIRDSGKSWSASDKASLRSLATGNTPTRVIGLELGPTPGAVQTQASKRGGRLSSPRGVGSAVGLVDDGLIYLDTAGQSGSDHWQRRPSQIGIKAATDGSHCLSSLQILRTEALCAGSERGAILGSPLLRATCSPRPQSR